MTGEIARMVVKAFHKRKPASEEIGPAPCESEILALVSRGLTNKEIAEKLGLSFPYQSKLPFKYLSHKHPRINLRTQLTQRAKSEFDRHGPFHALGSKRRQSCLEEIPGVRL